MWVQEDGYEVDVAVRGNELVFGIIDAKIKRFLILAQTFMPPAK